ncbi:hypothetical protein TWF730_003039 [Orbilia blumenaviensis]|uniref:Uncharacterized protein n=1 Tax=Orbilia blumenaviensis TaxID=1796055 RepID=A0AAV9U8N8_9PEZI
MKSFTKPLLFGVLAVGVSANGYGNDYSAPAVNTPCTTATPVTPQYQTSEAPPPPVYTAPTTVVPPPASSAPPEVTCPYTFIASCAYLCKGSNGVAYCSASDATNAGSYTTCTACPGAPAPSTSVVPPPYTPPPQTEPSSVPPPYTPPPQTEPSSVPPPYTPPPQTEPEPVPPTTLSTVTPPSPTPEVKCPVTYAPSCAYLCSYSGAPTGYRECSETDKSGNVGKVACSACPGAPVYPPNNATTPTYAPPAPTNGTTPYPTPTYNSGASALNIGTAVIFGLICMMFTL